jgi:hypothetical protein
MLVTWTLSKSKIFKRYSEDNEKMSYSLGEKYFQIKCLMKDWIFDLTTCIQNLIIK